VAGSGRAEEGSKQAEVEKQTGGQKHAGREERVVDREEKTSRQR
jgi:hypothetical protein